MPSRLARFTSLVFAIACAGCASSPAAPEWPPTVAFDAALVFPADRSLDRAEDGVVLPDGTLIVSDRAHGLRRIRPDGTNAPFGAMRSAGYVDDAPRIEAAANGVSLEPNGTHLLVADVLGGGIYRVALADGTAERVYQHPYGVNTAVRDSRGAIWFTQSTECTGKTGEARLFAAVDIGTPDGSLWRLDYRDGRLAGAADLVRGGFHFANGVVLDERYRRIYVAETCADRILAADLDVGAGATGRWFTFAEVATPDNVELDVRGRVWVACPLASEVRVIDPGTGEQRSVFRRQSQAQRERCAEFRRRGRDHEPRLELLTPEVWGALPGLVTGVILGPDGDLVCITGLGNAVIRASE